MVPPVPSVAHEDVEIVRVTEVAPHVLAITDGGVGRGQIVSRWHAPMIAAISFSSSVPDRTSMYVEASSAPRSACNVVFSNRSSRSTRFRAARTRGPHCHWLERVTHGGARAPSRIRSARWRGGHPRDARQV